MAGRKNIMPEKLAKQLKAIRKKRGVFVYILKLNNTYKIGYTGFNLRDRIYNNWLTFGCPLDADLYHYIPCFDEAIIYGHDIAIRAERQLHYKFSDKRLNRHHEFFDLSPQDLTYIKSIKEYRNGKYVFA